MNIKKKIIIDTDPGIDDAMAILFAEKHPEIDLLGLTTVFGNSTIDIVTSNALYLKQIFSLSCDIAQGVDKPLHGESKSPVHHIHGGDALGNTRVIDGNYGKLHTLNACDYLIEQIRTHPHEIILVPIGPLTNIALALKKAPDIANLVKEIIIMGGAFGYNGNSGNVTPVAEANIYCDPWAADQVLGADWPVTLVGLDVTHEVIMSPAFFESLKTQNTYGDFIHNIAQFYLAFYRSNGMEQGCATHDPLALIYAIAPEYFKTIKAPIRVVSEGISKGQTLAKTTQRRYGIDAWEKARQQTICTQVDAAACLALYHQTLSR